MGLRHYVDNAPQTTVSAAITAADTAITLASLAGYPTQYPYTATLGIGSPSAEQVLVTAATGLSVTVTRNWNGQGAFSHAAGETFNLTSVAADYADANTHVNSTTGVHGLAAGSGVVGTTDTQTLTNKTLTAPAITAPTVTGGVTADTVTASGGVTANGTGTGLAVAHDATVGGNLTVTGAVTGGSVTTAGVAQAHQVVGKATTAGDHVLSGENSTGAETFSVTDAGAVTAKGGVTVPGANSILSGDGTGVGLTVLGGTTTYGNAARFVPGKAGAVLDTTNVGNTAVNFTVDDKGNVTHEGSITSVGFRAARATRTGTSDNFTAGVMTALGTVTLPATAPAGWYAVTASVPLTCSASATGTYRVTAPSGSDLTSDDQQLVGTVRTPYTFADHYQHAGGAGTFTVSAQVSTGTGTVWNGPFHLSVAYIGA